MLEKPVSQEVKPEAEPKEVSPAPTATPAEHMIPKARLDEEIEKRKEFEKQIQVLSKQQAEGSNTKAALEKMTVQFQEMEKRAEFLESASAPELQCRNIKAAWLIAVSGDFFDKHGRPIWDAIKAEAPELFGATVAQANAGAGTGKPPSPAQNMNAFIRKAAGRG